MIRPLSRYLSNRKPSGLYNHLDVVEKRQTLIRADIRIAIAQSLTDYTMR